MGKQLVIVGADFSAIAIGTAKTLVSISAEPFGDQYINTAPTLRVTATWDDQSTSTASGWITSPPVWGSTVGQQTMDVSYTRGSVTKTTTVTADVNTVQLAAPGTVNLSGNALTWNNVANNSGYEILYRRADGEGEIYQTDIVDADVTQHTLTVTTAGTYSVTIVTIGAGSYTDSAESAAVTYIVQNKLATPTMAIDGNTLNIADVEDAQRYKIYANGELKTTVTKAD